MKIRTGFVSNSSSASFVIKWKRYNSEGKMLNDIGTLFKLSDFDIEENLENLDFFYEEEIKITNEIVDSTTELDKGIYLSSFFISMFNSPLDFGKASKLLMSLTLNRDTHEIIYSGLEK